MSENVIKASTTNELARERNRAAADRTLMAWIRTSIAMIGFGFGVGLKISRIYFDYAFNSWSSLGGLNQFTLRTVM